MMKRLLPLVLWIPSLAVAQLSWWACDEGNNVMQDYRSIPNPAYLNDSNRVHDRSGAVDTISLFGARNEVLCFQLVLRNGFPAIPHLNVGLPFLACGRSKIQNSSKDPTQYVGRYIEHFLLNPVPNTRRGPETFWRRNHPEPYEHYNSRFGEQWVPLEAAPKIIVGAGGDSTFGGAGNSTAWNGGAGFYCLRDRNTVVGTDIYIPKSAPSGVYRGRMRIWKPDTGDTLFSIPVKLRVYNFTLSDSTWLPSIWFYAPAAFTTYAGTKLYSEKYWTWVKKAYQMAHRHRIDLCRAQEHIETVRTRVMGYYTGWRYTASQGYEGPGANLGQRIYIAAMYNCNHQQYPEMRPGQAGPYAYSRDGWRSLARDYFRLFKDSVGSLQNYRILGVELIDEPKRRNEDPRQWAAIDTVAEWIRSSPEEGCQKIHLFATMGYLDPISAKKRPGGTHHASLSMWCPDPNAGLYSGHHLRKGNGDSPDLIEVEELREQGAGDRVKTIVGTYSAGEYAGFMPQMEFRNYALAETRLLPWSLWWYGDDFLLSWAISFWADVGGCNPWQKLEWEGSKVSSGEASYMYVGRDRVHPAEDRGIDFPIANSRMKAWRRGVQDYLYLKMAKDAGVYDTNWVHQAGLWASYDDPAFPSKHMRHRTPSWAYLNGYQLESVRQKMADALGSVGAGTPEGKKPVVPKGKR